MFDFNLNVDLNIENINKILTDYFDKEGFEVLTVEPQLKKHIVGSQMHECEEIIFGGFNIKLKKKEPKIIKSNYDNWS